MPGPPPVGASPKPTERVRAVGNGKGSDAVFSHEIDGGAVAGVEARAPLFSRGDNREAHLEVLAGQGANHPTIGVLHVAEASVVVAGIGRHRRDLT